MIRHVSMWAIKDEHEGKNKAQLLEEIKEGVLGLKGVTPTLIECEVGINCNPKETYDIVFIDVFEDLDGLQAYVDHPEHMKVVKLIKAVGTARACLDFEI